MLLHYWFSLIDARVLAECSNSSLFYLFIQIIKILQVFCEKLVRVNQGKVNFSNLLLVKKVKLRSVIVEKLIIYSYQSCRFSMSLLKLNNFFSTAYVERSPHEIYLPSYGIGLKPEDEGTVWKNGIKLRSSTEYPLHFTVGMTGCAFSILLNQYYKNGTECGVTVSNLKSYGVYIFKYQY